MTSHTGSTPRGRRTLLLVLSGALLVAFGWIVSGETVEAQSGQAAGVSDQVAVIQDTGITRGEIEEKAADALAELETQRKVMETQLAYQREVALYQAMQELIEQRLLELEAAAEGVTVEQLIAQEIQPAAVTDEEVDAFYQQLSTQRQGVPPKEQIAGQIKRYLEQQKPAEARQAYLGTLEEKYGVKRIQGEPKLPIETEGFPSKGPADAAVTIVEFSDFQCPFCARVVPTVDQLVEAYPEQVRVVFRQFPLSSIHPQAQKAAEASLCADAQGKFWEMHDAMFADQKALAVDDLKAKAATIGLDADKFATCLDSGEFADEVAADLTAGKMVGVSGTPAMFINGKRVEGGAVPFEQLAALVDAELKD